MAVCPSCGSVVSDASKFCTSCGGSLSANAPAPPPVAAATQVCTVCGAAVDATSTFCTNCGTKMPLLAAVALVQNLEPAHATEFAPAPPAVAVGVVSPPASTTNPEPVSINTPIQPAPVVSAQASDVCAGCGSRLEPVATFCTRCGRTVSTAPAVAANAPAVRQEILPPRETLSTPAPPIAETAAATPLVTSPQTVEPLRQPEPRIYPPRGGYQTQTEPSRRFGLLVLILLIVIVGAGFGGWYLWGVETIVVCSPPDARVSLDDKELPTDPFGRYVIPHLSRSPHLLKVQRRGFADTLQRLDFPLTSSREWITIVLVPSQPTRR